MLICTLDVLEYDEARTSGKTRGDPASWEWTPILYVYEVGRKTLPDENVTPTSRTDSKRLNEEAGGGRPCGI